MNKHQGFHKEPINITFTQYSFRKYGQPKLSKPKELKGIKQYCSIDYIPKKCKCQVFVLNDDVYIKHSDYFSPSMALKAEDCGQGLKYLAKKYCSKEVKTKFIYEDAWGDIVLRQEAWILIKNLVNVIKKDVFLLDIKNEILRQQEIACKFERFMLMCTPMERFWEKVIIELKKGGFKDGGS